MVIKNSITLGKQHSKPFLSVRFWSLLSLKRVQVGIGQSVFLLLFLFSLSFSAFSFDRKRGTLSSDNDRSRNTVSHSPETTAPEALLAL